MNGLRVAVVAVVCLVANVTLAQKQVALKDVRPTSEKEMKEVVGKRVLGKVVVREVKPDPDMEGVYLVRCVDASEKSLGVYKSWVAGKFWLQVRCLVPVPEDVALVLSEGDEINIAGNVVSAEAEVWEEKPNTVVILRLEKAKIAR